MSEESELIGADNNRIKVSDTGWTSRVYIIDGGKIVFKLPHNAKFREECKQEIATLKLIKEQNFSLNVPMLNWVRRMTHILVFMV